MVNMNEDSIDHEKRQQLIDWIENSTIEKDLINLMTKPVQYLDLYLYFIGFKQGKFQLINRYTFVNTNQNQNCAFIVLNGDLTMCGPLFSIDSNGEKQTAFALDDMCVKAQVEKYIEKLNQIDATLFPKIKENPIDSTNDSQLHEVSTPALDHQLGISDPSDNVMDVDETNHSSIQEDIQSLLNNYEINSQSQTIPGPPLTEIEYNAPIIDNQPQSKWKGRYPSDLVMNERRQTDSTKVTQTKYIGLLQGCGSQRSRIRVKIPDELQREKQDIYLSISTRTVNGEQHTQKVIVPDKTRVNIDLLNKENRLDYLDFGQCDQWYYFDATTRTVYMKITNADYEKQIKEIPIYMFNLYQNARLTKSMIERFLLDQCRLAFWFSIKRDDKYISKSQESLSCRIIEEKKKKNTTNPP